MKYITSFIFVFISLNIVVCQNTYDWAESNSQWSYAIGGKTIINSNYVPAPMKREMTLSQATVELSNSGLFSYDLFSISQFGIKSNMLNN